MLSSTSPRPFVFVLMPFDAEFDDVYKLGIRPACEAAGAYCERVDEQIFQESILQRIYNQIAKSDFVVADVTGKNLNVFYEIGYAHALGKTVILLTKDVNDIPFDLKHYPHLVYGGKITLLREDLEKRLRWHIQNSQNTRSKAEGGETLVSDLLEFYIVGQRVESGTTLKLENFPDDDLYDFEVAIHNPSKRVYRGYGQDLGLIVPSGLLAHGPGPYGEEEPFQIKLPDGRMLYTFGPVTQILPDAWETASIQLSMYPESELWSHSMIPVVVRLFTETGPRDLQINLVVSRAMKESSERMKLLTQNER